MDEQKPRKKRPNILTFRLSFQLHHISIIYISDDRKKDKIENNCAVWSWSNWSKTSRLPTLLSFKQQILGKEYEFLGRISSDARNKEGTHFNILFFVSSGVFTVGHFLLYWIFLVIDRLLLNIKSHFKMMSPERGKNNLLLNGLTVHVLHKTCIC